MAAKVNRRLSVHQEHELLLKLEAAGLNEAAAQKVIESHGNKLAKKMLGLIGASKPLSLTEAAEIVGNGNFFGPNEWLVQFGKKFRLSSVPEIPWSEDELRNPGLNQKHFLFLGIENLDGKPLDLPAWHKLCPGPKHPKFYLEWYLDQSQTFARATCQLRWYLMPVGIVDGSASLSYGLQLDILPSEYEVPTATERATANVLFHFLNGKYLDEVYWARTKDLSKSGSRVNVRGFSDSGINVGYWSSDAHPSIGVAASRKFVDS